MPNARQTGEEQSPIPSKGSVPEEQEAILSDRIVALAEDNRIDEAIALADQAMTLDPTDDEACVLAAWALMRKGDVQRAAVLLKQALSLDPDNEDARNYLSILASRAVAPRVTIAGRASFGRRMVAHIIDSILVVTVYLVLIVPMMFAVPQDSPAFPVVIIFVYVLYLGLPVLYFTLWESSKTQASPGKLAMRIKVQTADGRRLTRRHAFARSCAKLLSGLIFGIGFLLMLIVPEKNTLHDQLTKTTVVKRGEVQA